MKRLNDGAWLMIVAAIVRLPTLGSESLWYDETFTVWVAKLDPGRMFTAIQGDVHPPLWYMLEAAIIRLFGSSEIALRLPSAMAGIAAVYVLWLIARHTGLARWPAMAAGTMLAIMPAAIYYSQEARMYSLLLLLVLLAILWALQKRWALFGITLTVIAFTQNLGMAYVLVLGTGATLIAIRNRHRLRDPLLAMLWALVVWATLWMPVALSQAANMGSGFWLQPLSLGGVFEPLYLMILLNRGAGWLMYPSFAAIAGLTFVSLITAWRWLLRDGLLIALVIFGVPAGLALASIIWRSVYLPRAMIACTALLPILWAKGLASMAPANRRIGLAIVIPAFTIGLVSYYLPFQGNRIDWRDRVAPVLAQWQPGDVAFYGSINAAIGFGYYVNEPYALRHEGSDLNQSLTPQTESAMGFREMEFDQLASAGYRRAWLFVDLNPMSSREEIDNIAAILAKYPHTLYRQFLLNQYASDAIYEVKLQ